MPGKTTTAIYLAAGLHQQGRTLLGTLARGGWWAVGAPDFFMSWYLARAAASTTPTCTRRPAGHRQVAQVRVRQVHRLLRIFCAVDRARDEVSGLIAEVQAELPGELPPGTIVTATRVERGE